MISFRSCSNRLLALLPLVLLLLAAGCARLPVEAGRTDGPLVAVYPMEDLSGADAPLAAMRSGITERLRQSGVRIMDEADLRRFMEQQRIRYTGGLDLETATAFKARAGVDAVLIMTLEYYSEVSPPKVSLVARLVATGEKPEILWMDSVGMAGDDAPGILGIGIVEDPSVLWNRALDRLSGSMLQNLAGKAVPPSGWEGRFRPKEAYRFMALDPKRRYSVAVLPFFNESERTYAGEIMVLHVVKQLASSTMLSVLEPGVIRGKMLAMRIIMQNGISLPAADLLANNLETDFILTGRVFEYRDMPSGSGRPRVDFSLQLLERSSKMVVWATKSRNTGDDGVFFYDWRRISTANVLTEGMMRALLGVMVEDTREVKMTPPRMSPEELERILMSP